MKLRLIGDLSIRADCSSDMLVIKGRPCLKIIARYHPPKYFGCPLLFPSPNPLLAYTFFSTLSIRPSR
jgi:hypothetical protein